jgi:hypothetical protein
VSSDPESDADIDVEVTSQPHHDKLKEVVLETLRSVGKPLKLAELREAIRERGYNISDDVLRDVVRELIVASTLIEFPDSTIGFPEWMKWYIPRNDIKRARPISSYKFYKLYGIHAPKIRRMGLPVEEALNIIRCDPLRAGSLSKPFVKRVGGGDI